MIKLLISDIGGVLEKTDVAIIRSIEAVCKKRGIPQGSTKDILKTFGTSLYDYVLFYLPKGYKKHAKACYLDFKKIYPSHARRYMKVLPGVDSTLTKLKRQNIKIAILSCMVKDEVDASLSLLSFKDFDLVFSLEDYKKKRPDPYGLTKIMKRFCVLPSETIYIGDTVNDIRMAKNAKVICVAITTGLQDASLLKHERPDHLIDSFGELVSIINNYQRER